MAFANDDVAAAGQVDPPATSSTQRVSFTTVSGRPIEPLYTRQQLEAAGEREESDPGQFPFTRGIHASMYRGKLWTMRQFAGFGTPQQTNERFRFLVGKGQTGLSTAFDLPTLMGLDSDDPRAAGEVGRLGVAVDTIEDMRRLFADIDIGQLSVSMTINAPAIVLMAFYLAQAEDRGLKWGGLRGTVQNDILKEFHAQNEFVFPPAPHVRLVIDVIEFCTRHVPKWYPISISGYHIREAGATAVQELAFTLADGMHYVEQCLERDMKIDDFASRLSFFFNAHNDIFEEVAKYRAAREIWADLIKTRYAARDPSSCKLRFHAQTAGCSLQDKVPELNLVRVAYQALAAVLGGCQSLHTNSMDETLALPSPHAATLALLTQQVLACETGVINTVDPLGGSYFVETLTRQIRRQAESYFDQIENLGGMLAGIENSFFRNEIAAAAFQYQRDVDAGRKSVVGVNAFEQNDARPMDIHSLDESVENEQIEFLRSVKKQRSQQDLNRALSALRRAADGHENLMPALLDAARARASVGESMDALAEVFGRYETVPT